MVGRVTEQDVLHALERQDRIRLARLKQLLRDEGRPDLIIELEARLKDIETGVAGAQSTWHALSKAQRAALKWVASAWRGTLYRHAPNLFGLKEGCGPGLPAVRLATIRNLIARELVACEGGAFDPERVVVITERGRFTLKYGPQK